MTRIGIVAGEASGDFLAAELMKAIREKVPDAVFEGIAGPRMVEEGCKAIFDAEELSVMGLVEVLKHLPRLLKVRKRIRRYFLDNPPDVFIGVDAPDFNLPLERKLKAAAIPTVHYVSPSVWAWREKRVTKIGQSVDLMLTLFPFENRVYDAQGIPVKFVGHPLAEVIPEVFDQSALRQRFGLPLDKPVLALLPGSRMGEVSRLSRDFIETALWCLERHPGMVFIAPFATAKTRALFEEEIRRVGAEELPITLVDGQSREVMGAADAVLLASGTATLEALLLKRPMVIAYRLSPLTYQLARRLIKVPYYSLPNNLAGRYLVPEITQDEVRAEVLGPAVLSMIEEPDVRERLQQAFAQIREQLSHRSSREAAAAIVDML